MADQSIQLFNNPEFGQLRAVTDDSGEPWFVAKDVCKALGIRTDSIHSILDDDEVSETNPNTIGVAGGRNPLIVSEAGLYALVLKSRKPEAHAFQRWVTHDVLPAIRKRGGYMVARQGETKTETLARAVLIATDALKEKDARIAELEPKALFADAVAASDGTCLVGELAKMIRQNGVKVGQNRLFDVLRQEGYLGTTGNNYNVPTQRAMEMGLFRIKETAITHSDGHVTINRTAKVTGKGQRYFVNRYTHQEVIA
jgi:anti-repressor protein